MWAIMSFLYPTNQMARTLYVGVFMKIDDS